MGGSFDLETIYMIARNLSGTDAEALDLTEAALRVAWEAEAIGEMPEGISFRTFVCRFLVREALSRLPEMRASGPVMDALTRRSDLAERLREALDWLEPEDRAAFVLRVVHELPPRECADILEMPVADVRQNAHQASVVMSAVVKHLMAQSGPVQPALRRASIR
jgi:RNA polymerase sigma factor (sigma-70 family)